MQQESRVKKSLLNARVNLIFYFITLALSFFSRKIFLDCLGPDFVGLSGTLVNILGFLSLAEMGVGAAVSYNLYNPLQRGDKSQIEELVSVFGYLYRRIGTFVAFGGLAISAFIPLVFKDSGFSLPLIFFAFYAILSSSLFSYFINYRQIILGADQRGYVVTTYLQSAAVVKTLIQMAIAYYWGNYYAWIALEIVFGLLVCVILNWKIAQTYPWLNANVNKGKEVFPRHKKIITFTKQIFVHKIKDFLLFQSDQILVFAFVSLKMVAYYGNYTLITTKLTQLFSTVLNSFWASVGNLVAEEDKEKTMRVFWEIQALHYLIAGFIIFSVYHFIEPFISLWVGAEYILDRTILVLLMINSFILLTRGAVDVFNSGHGQYADTWSAWAEGITNIGVTLVCAPIWGIAGILTGKIVSLFFFIVLWKPYYLFHSGFQLPIYGYWMETLKLLLIFGACFYVGHHVYLHIPIDASVSLTNWATKGLLTLPPFAFIQFVTMYVCCEGMRNIVHRLLFKVKR